MTMLAYYIKPVLELIPEALPMVKQASIDKEYPTNSRDSTMASALAIQYMIKIANKVPDYSEMEKVSHAVRMYDIYQEIASLSKEMVKRAHDKTESTSEVSQESYMNKESAFHGSLTGFSDIEEVSKEAKGLYKLASVQGHIPSEEVTRYSSHMSLNKEAALKSLSVRYNLTKEAEYIKLAQALGNTDSLEQPIIELLADKVTGLDKKASLNFKGFNFYKEAFYTKEAAVSALNIKLAGQNIPYESFAKVGKANLSSYIGKDIADEFDKGPVNFKQVVETLPLDLQKVLISLTKSV